MEALALQGRKDFVVKIRLEKFFSDFQWVVMFGFLDKGRTKKLGITTRPYWRLYEKKFWRGRRGKLSKSVLFLPLHTNRMWPCNQ